MGKRKRKKIKMKFKNPISLKYVFLFSISFMLGIFVLMFAFTPFNNIPFFESIIGDNFAYTTPIMLFSELLPAILLIVGVLGTIFIVFIIIKFFGSQ